MLNSSEEKLAQHMVCVLEDKLIIRTVASSTAIETGQSVLDIERKLKEADVKYQDLKLGL